ncbi:MAG TPA: GNAT family N-acetyltransferase [Solirubrobacterales bacterium]|nr:GNAT family N-acetyltransferase [Solirubrobacterales bacterium]
MQRLVVECPPLTLHTPYTYWVILSRSARLCIGAFEGKDLIGMALSIPTLERRAFVWQIGVCPPFRGRHVGHGLLERAWQAAGQAGLRSLETTIGKENEASVATFSSFACANGLDFRAVAEAIPRDANGSTVEPEIEYRLCPRARDD